MVLVLLLGAAIWWLGARMKAPVQARALMLGALYLGVLLALFVLPDGHPIRARLGGSLGEWLVLGGAVALVLAYRAILKRLRARADRHAPKPTPQDAPQGPFSETELTRYARHIVLREIGGTGQRALKEARVLVVGAGGLGCPALMYLAGAGVGTLGVIDDDTVSLSNLQRQVLHRDAEIGTPKVFSAQAALLALNPHIDVRPYRRRFTPEIAADLLADYDLVIDGCDSFATRQAVNAAAVAAGVPLIAGAISQWEGQITLYDPTNGAPCLACLFPQAPAPGQAATCAEAGVAGPLPGVIGTMMALEAVKAITGAGQTLRGRMLLYDGLAAETRMIKIAKRPDCAVCGPRPNAQKG